jgi:hypothetical protein
MTHDAPPQGTVDDRMERDKALMLEQLRKTPVVQIACEKTQIGRTSYYRWRREDDAFAQAADEALDEGKLLVNDVAESQLLAAIRDGNFAAVTYWLRHHHASYRTKLELSGTLRHLDDRLTPEQEREVRDAMRLMGFLRESDKTDSSPQT